LPEAVVDDRLWQGFLKPTFSISSFLSPGKAGHVLALFEFGMQNAPACR
jgi:hypothetical protein